jgi:hypothetical protein
MDWSGQLSSGRQTRSYSETGFKEIRADVLIHGCQLEEGVVYTSSPLSLCMTWGAPFAIIFAGSVRTQ